VVTPGHSPGHTSYIITSSTGKRLIALGDAFHIPAQLGHLDWSSLPDIDGAAVLAARRKLMQELEQPGTVGFACHFGDQAFGRLTRPGAGLPGWEPVPRRRLSEATGCAANSFGPVRGPVLQWGDDGQFYRRGRASYRLAGCRCLT